MARVKIQDIVEHLDYGFKRALEDSINRTFPDLNIDRNQIFREFCRAVGRKCSTWESVPDHYVESD